MRLLLGLLPIVSLSMASQAAHAQRETMRVETSSGRKYSVHYTTPGATMQRVRDPIVIVHSEGAWPRPDVTLKVRDLLLLAQNLAQFRTNEEMAQAGFVPWMGDAIRKGFKPSGALGAEELKRQRGIETKARVEKILNDMYKESGGLTVPSEEIQEVALMVALNDEATGRAAFGTIQKTEILPQIAGFAADLLALNALVRVPLLGWTHNFCSRVLGRDSEVKFLYATGFLIRAAIAGAGVVDAGGRVRDLVDGLDPGWSPLLSAIIFGNMDNDPDGDAIRTGATEFQNRYQGK